MNAEQLNALLDALIKMGGPECTGVIVVIGGPMGTAKETLLHKTLPGSHIDGLAAGLRAALGAKPPEEKPLVLVPQIVPTSRGNH